MSERILLKVSSVFNRPLCPDNVSHLPLGDHRQAFLHSGNPHGHHWNKMPSHHQPGLEKLLRAERYSKSNLGQTQPLLLLLLDFPFYAQPKFSPGSSQTRLERTMQRGDTQVRLPRKKYCDVERAGCSLRVPFSSKPRKGKGSEGNRGG